MVLAEAVNFSWLFSDGVFLCGCIFFGFQLAALFLAQAVVRLLSEVVGVLSELFFLSFLRFVGGALPVVGGVPSVGGTHLLGGSVLRGRPMPVGGVCLFLQSFRLRGRQGKLRVGGSLVELIHSLRRPGLRSRVRIRMPTFSLFFRIWTEDDGGKWEVLTDKRVERRERVDGWRKNLDLVLVSRGSQNCDDTNRWGQLVCPVGLRGSATGVTAGSGAAYSGACHGKTTPNHQIGCVRRDS